MKRINPKIPFKKIIQNKHTLTFLNDYNHLLLCGQSEESSDVRSEQFSDTASGKVRIFSRINVKSNGEKFAIIL